MWPDLEPHKEILVLNSDYTPINICSWKRAINLLLKSRAVIINKRVVRLEHFVKLPYRRLMNARPSKKNILRHYDYQCVYCGSFRQLTIDHVIPVSKGGQNTWNNMVCACVTCNVKKGDKTLEQANLTLYIKPTRPFNTLFSIIEKSNVPEWLTYSR